jgi:hypothetical protein
MSSRNQEGGGRECEEKMIKSSAATSLDRNFSNDFSGFDPTRYHPLKIQKFSGAPNHLRKIPGMTGNIISMMDVICSSFNPDGPIEMQIYDLAERSCVSRRSIFRLLKKARDDFGIIKTYCTGRSIRIELTRKCFDFADSRMYNFLRLVPAGPIPDAADQALVDQVQVDQVQVDQVQVDQVQVDQVQVDQVQVDQVQVDQVQEAEKEGQPAPKAEVPKWHNRNDKMASTPIIKNKDQNNKASRSIIVDMQQLKALRSIIDPSISQDIRNSALIALLKTPLAWIKDASDRSVKANVRNKAGLFFTLVREMPSKMQDQENRFKKSFSLKSGMRLKYKNRQYIVNECLAIEIDNRYMPPGIICDLIDSGKIQIL